MQYFFPELNYLPRGAAHLHTINGGNTVFNSFRVTERNKGSRVISTSDVKKEFLKKFISKPNSKLELNFDTTLVMGVLNVTPDSFYDGEQSFSEKQFVEKGLNLLKAGCCILDVGGESTRPGAKEVASSIETVSYTHLRAHET